VHKRRKKVSVVTKPFISDEIAFDVDPESREKGNINGDYDVDDDATHEYYDPAKLTFIFSTPSPLIKKSSQFEETEKTNKSPNHSYDEDSVEPPIVTKIEDLLKFTNDFQTTFKKRRQKVIKSFEEQSSDDENYDDENDATLQASANVPIVKNRIDQNEEEEENEENNHHEEHEQIKEEEEKDVSTATTAATTVGSELEEKSFPMERHYDVSHAQYGNF
jgi:hypothetical protein